MTSVSNTAKTPAPSAPVTPAVAAANKTLNLLLKSSDVTQALSTQSSHYLPATSGQVLSTLWALFNTSGSHTINKATVQQGVLAEGGTPGAANALWAQLDPNGNSSISAEAFVTNKYLTQAVTANLKTVQTAVATIQQQAGPGTKTLRSSGG